MASAADAQAPDPPADPPAGSTTSASAPPPAELTYRLTRTVSDGTGTYADYSDSLVASGRYSVVPSGDALRIEASYRWRYQGERCEDGQETRTARVRLADRLYEGPTDLDDYDETPPSTPLGVWLWISPETQSGASVRILEHDFAVSRGAFADVHGHSLPAILAEAHGESRREDEYGNFNVRWADAYYFDEVTGYFLRSEHTEIDDNAQASFEQTETTVVGTASYLPAEAWSPVADVARCPRTSSYVPAPDPVPRTLFFFALLAVAGAVGFFLLRRQRRAPIRVDGRPVSVTRVARIEEIPSDVANTGRELGPFVSHLARCALSSGERVSVAKLDDGRIVGVAIADGEGRTATLFAQHGDACELLRRDLGVTEFFSEYRHVALPSVVAVADTTAAFSPTSAYNLVETLAVLERKLTAAPAYDASRVSRASAEDLAGVAKLAAGAREPTRERYRKSAFDNDEVVLVSRVDGEVVGAISLTVVGEHARISQLTVAEAARGRGLGAELVRGALHHASALGATSVLAEVREDAVAAQALLAGLEFQPKGTVHLESAASAPPGRRVPWR